MPDRKIKITWRDLEVVLQKQNLILTDEAIGEIILKKPKEILFHTKKKGEVPK